FKKKNTRDRPVRGFFNSKALKNKQANLRAQLGSNSGVKIRDISEILELLTIT
ncbi:MAG: hypothetical protein K940chlam7_01439, partial [Chlamydiae bacterium]|nr:hypothetical protein [Chlamydiota bacterium]